MGGMVKRSSEAERLLAQLDSELAKSSESSGTRLSWSAAEVETLRAIGDTVDRRVHLTGRYANCDPLDAKNLVRLSCEIRQCDSLVSRLLARISTDPPAASGYNPYESQATKHARTAARKRWNPGWTPGATG
jgi:hypothetical protein